MSSSNKRVSNLTKSVTDGSGATHFYDVLNGASVVGNAMGVFAQGAASTGHGGRDAGRIAFVRGVLMEPTKIESVIRRRNGSNNGPVGHAGSRYERT